jgi:hypothetical protein
VADNKERTAGGDDRKTAAGAAGDSKGQQGDRFFSAGREPFHDRRSRTSRATFRNRAAPTGRTPRAKTAARVRSRARNRAPTPEAYRAGLRTTFVQPFLRWSKFS